MSAHPWTLLGIEPTTDDIEIRRAYARQLKKFRPDEDPVGFQRLVAARDTALNWLGPLPSATPEAVGREHFDPEPRSHVVDLEACEGSGTENEAEPALDQPLAGPDDPTPIPPIGQELVSEAGPLSPLPIGEPMPDESADAYALLDGLLAIGNKKAKPINLVTWRVSNWEPLFRLVDDMSLAGRYKFRNVFVSKLFKRLPEQNGVEEAIYDFSIGQSIAAVIERIEAEYHFSQDQAELAGREGIKAVGIYMSWVATASGTRALLNRARRGKSAYWDERGLPVFPEDDKTYAVPKSLQDWLDESLKAGRWLLSFNPMVLVLPAGRSANVGLAPIGLGFILLTIAWLLFKDFSSDIGMLTAAGTLGALLSFRIAWAFFLPRVAILAAIRRVRRADRELAWSHDRRFFTIRPRGEQRISDFMALADVCLLIAVLGVVVFQALPAWEIRDFKGVAPEILWSNLVLSAIDGTAADDKLESKVFVRQFENLISSRAEIIPNRGLVDANRIGDWSSFVMERKSIQAYLNRPGSQQSLPAAQARAAKLHLVADAYRKGSVEERIDIENQLLDWIRFLRRADEPLDEAAVWAAMWPQTPGAALKDFPALVRRVALHNLLQESRESFETVGATEAAIHRFATETDARFFLHLTPDLLENPAQAGRRTDSGAVLSTEQYYAQVLGRPLPLIGTIQNDDWNNYFIARSAFYEMADACLKATHSTNSILATQAVLASAIKDLPANITARTDLWWITYKWRLGDDPNCLRTINALRRRS